MQQGDIVICVLAGEYGKPRPAVVIQSDLFNDTHASITVCPIASHLIEAPLFRLPLSPLQKNGLEKPSQIMVDKITTLQRNKIHQKIGELTRDQQNQLRQAIKLWFNLIE